MILVRMKKFIEDIGLETLLGGIFGIITVISAIAEYYYGDKGAFFACIKDVCGTLVVIVLLFVAIKPSSQKLEKKLEKSLSKWAFDNCPLIFKAYEYRSDKFDIGYKLLQSPESYLDLIANEWEEDTESYNEYARYEHNNKTGQFLHLPSVEKMIGNNFKIKVVLKQTHFEKIENIDSKIEKMKSSIKTKYIGKSIQQLIVDKNKEFEISCKKISTNEDIQNFVEMLEFLLALVRIVI